MKVVGSPTRFVCTFSDDGCWVELSSAAVGVPTNQWIAVATPEELPRAAHLLSLSEDDKAQRTDEGVFLPNATLAGLGDTQVRALNLPEPAPFVLELRAKGTLSDAAFRFETRWYRQDGLQLPIATIRGAEFSTGGKRYLVLDPLYTVLQRVEQFNANPPDALDKRMEFWGELRALMGGEGVAEIKPDRYLDNMRVYRATRFTLDLQTRPDGSIDFDPILLTSENYTRPTDDDVPQEESEPGPLLPPVASEKFARRFREHDAARPQYAVDGGIYVVFGDKTQEALSIVREMQRAQPELRKQFARNPRAFIREALGTPQALDADAIDPVEALFIETQQFSDRVRELGLWERPILPWLTARTRGWLPPEFIPVVISGEQYNVQVDEVPALADEVQSAIERREPHVDYRDQLIPATAEARQVLTESQERLKAEADAWLAEQDESEKEESQGPYSFKGGENDNFEVEGFVARQRPRSHAGFDLPLLASTLKPHQEEGVAWLQHRWASGFSGALLADDMGLGKTFQCLAFLAWLRQQMAWRAITRKPFLIVAPTGLIQNWLQEQKQHLRAPGLGQSLVALGPALNMYRHSERRKDVKGGTPALRVEELREFDVIFTTYETLRDYQFSFALIPFAVAIFDEAQKVKNPGALVTNVAKHLNSEFFIASTGTPVENRLADLWSITDVIQPGYLGPLREFSRKYEDDKEDPEIRIARLQELRSKIETPQGRTAPGMMVRRLKTSTLRGLPAKHEHVRPAIMPPSQASAYDQAVEVGRRMKRGPKDALLALQQLRNISLHHLAPGTLPDEAYVAESARLSALFDILDGVRNANEKALVFLESLEMQKYLAALIQRRYGLGHLPMIISGEVAGAKRQDRVNRFQEDFEFDVMILSPKAGGVGLTLTRANHVVHLSRWWNPAVEDQCTDRIYRIGQDKPVHIHYLQAVHPQYHEHSFDVKLHDLLERKRALSRDLLIPSTFGDGDATQLYNETFS